MPAAADATQTPSEDSDLMRRVQASDEAAFTALMRRWELPVKTVIARIVLNSAEADDLAQETFVRLWQQRARFEPERPVKPWILGIAVNLARNRLRWWRRRPLVALDDWTELPTRAAENAAGLGRMEQTERVAAIRDAVAELPIEMREALVLFEYEQMSYAEIAEAVGVTTKAIENRISRAREKLRPRLERWL
jgi:RNA polymerase sigma factor (sigma-70 family)